MTAAHKFTDRDVRERPQDPLLDECRSCRRILCERTRVNDPEEL